MDYRQLLVASVVVLCSLALVSAAAERKKRISIEQIADGCRVGKTSNYVCCFECSTCSANGVKVPSCHGRREADTSLDYWMQRRFADYWDEKPEERRAFADYWDSKVEEQRAMDYWDAKAKERKSMDYWDTKAKERRASSDYWDTRAMVDYWMDKRGFRCRVRVYEGVHRCCVRRNGCSCPKDVVARCA